MGHFQGDQGPMNSTISRNLPVTLISRQKSCYMIIKHKFCKAQLVSKSANYASSAFIRKIGQNYAFEHELH